MNAIKPVTLVVGHYGVGKTNFSVNLAIDLVEAGKHVTLVDIDIVNPYFRATEQRRVLEEHGVELVAPVFAEAGSSLDVPSLTGKITPAIQQAQGDRYVVIDVGGDDAGSIAVGRYARTIMQREHAVLCVLNKYRNLVQDPADAVENMREIEQASRMNVSALVSNAHLKGDTTPEVVREGQAYAREIAHMTGLPLVATCCSPEISGFINDDGLYRIKMYVRSPWE